MNKQELVEVIEALPAHNTRTRPLIDKKVVLGLVRQLDEPKKVVVPQFVAEYIKYARSHDWDLQDAMDSDFITSEEDGNFSDWFYTYANMELFAQAWIFGYEVEKEKRYEVILCNGQSLKTVYRQGEDRLDFEKEYGDLESFTRTQLEEANFGWVFDCEGIEVKEMEE